MHELLVVDDEKDMCRMISSFLTDEGYRVDKAYDGGQAIKKISAKGYDLMILDYKLPDMTGINLLAEVRRMDPELKVIMISAYGSSHVKAMAKHHGVKTFLDKPFDLTRLTKAVKIALDKKGQNVVDRSPALKII